MKHILQKLLLFAYLCLLTINYSCETEKEYVEKGNNTNLKFNQILFKELKLAVDFDKILEKFKFEKAKNAFQRSAIEDQFNFTIVENREVNVVEIDNKKYYNILIKREIESLGFYENLLFEVTNENNLEEIKAYIVKYNFNGTEIPDKELTLLFGKVSNNCFLVCDLHCPGKSPDETVVCEPILTCHPFCFGPSGSGGNESSEDGNTSSGGGGGDGVPPGSVATLPEPQNLNGTTQTQTLPDIIVAPVETQEQQTLKTPCSELQKLTSSRKHSFTSNPLNNKKTIDFANTNLSSLTNLSVEISYTFFLDGLGEYYAIKDPELGLETGSRYSNKANAVGGNHTHHEGLIGMFSPQDITTLLKNYNYFSYYTGGIPDASIPVNLVTSPDGIYAIKIEDLTKLQNLQLNTINDKENYNKFIKKLLDQFYKHTDMQGASNGTINDMK